MFTGKPLLAAASPRLVDFDATNSENIDPNTVRGGASSRPHVPLHLDSRRRSTTPLEAAFASTLKLPSKPGLFMKTLGGHMSPRTFSKQQS